jgi:hypothetical protein
MFSGRIPECLITKLTAVRALCVIQKVHTLFCPRLILGLVMIHCSTQAV